MAPRAFLLLLFVSVLPAGWAKETMQEVIDRLLTGYSRNCNPTLAFAERLGKLDGTCGPKPAPVGVGWYMCIAWCGKVASDTSPPCGVAEPCRGADLRAPPGRGEHSCDPDDTPYARLLHHGCSPSPCSNERLNDVNAARSAREQERTASKGTCACGGTMGACNLTIRRTVAAM